MLKSMKILVDANVILDSILSREGFSDSADKIMDICAGTSVEGYVAAHSFSIIYYVMRKQYSDPDERRDILLDLCDVINIAELNRESVISSLKRKDFKDFEDCLQDECGYSQNVDYIVTNNIKDFSTSKTQVILLDDFLELEEIKSLLV